MCACHDGIRCQHHARQPRRCPRVRDGQRCTGVLQRYSGRDGYRIVPVRGEAKRQRSSTPIRTCNVCEHCEAERSRP